MNDRKNNIIKLQFKKKIMIKICKSVNIYFLNHINLKIHQLLKFTNFTQIYLPINLPKNSGLR